MSIVIEEKDVGVDLNDRAISYLQMVQSNIERMSTSSAIFKGFAATIVAGITAISFSEVNSWILLMSFLPVLCFLALDVYYLNLEKRYRKLYQNIVVGRQEINFDLDVRKFKGTRYRKRQRQDYVPIWESFKSPSIYLFYPWLIAILIIVVILKFGGVIV